ncbi:hypothetical protein [Schlesneria paludicola]|uniref:hypothetical protein n=1 Tax=Schlesneria paludicola TaxID=360056 RepID=UPI000299E06C|nr:hypothetical protein [Schlesneria paludicola]
MTLTNNDSIHLNETTASVDDQTSLSTVVAYLFGSRAAILNLASNRGTIWLSLLLVISAGFAREYDGEDLLHQPAHLFLPLIASLATSMLLFSLIYLLSLRRQAGTGNFLGAYLIFLGLYWMTAPLAWLYAIPFERFMNAADAVSMNLNLLGLVSIWRVLLITRVIAVIFNARLETFFPVMLFADTVALFLTSLVPVPLMATMGGIRLTESESIISNRTMEVVILGMLSYPVWLLGTCVVFSLSTPVWTWMVTDRQSIDRIRRSVWVVATLMILGWIVVLPIT